MSSETLRRAAALMRERAEVATPGPWTCYGDHLVWPSDQGPAANDPILAMVGEAHEDSAEHIASWHPAVALAVAEWLDSEATRWEQVAEFDKAYGDEPDAAILAARANDARHALAVARAYLMGDQ